MGKITETKTITVCDKCGRQSTLLDSCSVCEQDICSYCQADGRDSAYFNRAFSCICKECIKLPSVLAVQRAFRAIYWGLTEKQKEAFGKISEKKKDESCSICDSLYPNLPNCKQMSKDRDGK